MSQPVAARRVAEPLPVYDGQGLQPGVDLTDSSALEDLMSGQGQLTHQVSEPAPFA